MSAPRRLRFEPNGVLSAPEQRILQSQLDALFDLVSRTVSYILDSSPSVGGGVVEVGSVMIRDVDGWRALPPGAAGTVLRSNGPGLPPSWQ